MFATTRLFRRTPTRASMRTPTHVVSSNVVRSPIIGDTIGNDGAVVSALRSECKNGGACRPTEDHV